MSTKKFDIRAVLRAHLMLIAELPPVSWENRLFTPPKNGSGDNLPYIRETLLPAGESLTANNERTGVGIYQLDLFVPIGYSISTAENLADQIKQHFRPAQSLSGLMIERSAVGQGAENTPWYFIPIQIDYRAHSNNVQPA